MFLIYLHAFSQIRAQTTTFTLLLRSTLSALLLTDFNNELRSMLTEALEEKELFERKHPRVHC